MKIAVSAQEQELRDANASDEIYVTGDSISMISEAVQTGKPVAIVPCERDALEALDVEEHTHLVSQSAAGAVVTFSGVVRDHDGGRGVQALEYSSHPSAGDVITRVAHQIAKAHPDVLALAVSHRIGPLEIGDSALACAVAAPHRAAAFAACAALGR